MSNTLYEVCTYAQTGAFVREVRYVERWTHASYWVGGRRYSRHTDSSRVFCEKANAVAHALELIERHRLLVSLDQAVIERKLAAILEAERELWALQPSLSGVGTHDRP